MAVCGINNDHVNTGFNQRFDTFFSACTCTDSSTNTQTTLVIFCSTREGFGLLDVFYGHHANELFVVIKNQNFLNAVNVQKILNVLGAGAFFNGNQLLFRRHHRGDRRIQVFLEANITAGNDTHQLFAINHRHTRDAVLLSQFENFADGARARHGDRVFDHTAFVLFDLTNLSSLFLDGQVFVDDT